MTYTPFPGSHRGGLAPDPKTKRRSPTRLLSPGEPNRTTTPSRPRPPAPRRSPRLKRRDTKTRASATHSSRTTHWRGAVTPATRRIWHLLHRLATWNDDFQRLEVKISTAHLAYFTGLSQITAKRAIHHLLALGHITHQYTTPQSHRYVLHGYPPEIPCPRKTR